MSWREAPHARRSTPLLLAFVAVLAWLCTAQGFGRAGQDGAFSPDELHSLRAGQLVKREAREERGSLQLMGGSSWQLIDAPPDVVYRALLDTGKYKRMLPAVTGSTLVAEQPGSRVVRLEHKRGPIGVSYDVRARFYPERRDITFGLEHAPGGAPRAAWGFFSVRPYGQAGNLTLLSYGVMADPGDGILVGILRGVVHDWMLQVPRLVKGFVESHEGRALYRL
jgi:ribosome-associated toxin RatA of RatAB toxin-antitoxin module